MCSAAQDIGRIVLLLSCAAICCLPLISALGCQPKETLTSGEILHEEENGEAALNYSAHHKKEFVFSANLDLPEVRGNRSWYCVWLMLGELKGSKQLPSMLQVGLMRSDQSEFQMQPFITTEKSGSDLITAPITNNLIGGYHRFAIAADSSKIELRMDGKTLLSAPRAEFFKGDPPVYLKIAAEVYAVGDKASGLVEDISFVSEGVSDAPPILYDAFEDRGLKFLCRGRGRWEVTGRFDPKLHFLEYVPAVCR